MTPSPVFTEHRPWLAVNRAEPHQPLREGSWEFAALLLNWFRQLPETAMLEWVVEAEAGGGIQSWIRCHDADPEELSLLAAATEEAWEVAPPPPARGGLTHMLHVNLGGPVAWRAETVSPCDGPVERARWLAERGLGLRLTLRLWPLAPLESSRRRVERAQASTSKRGLLFGLHEVEPAERLLEGVVFEVSIASDRPLSTAERTLLTRSCQNTFAPGARLTDQGNPALAEGKLALSLVQEFASTRPELPELSGSEGRQA